MLFNTYLQTFLTVQSRQNEQVKAPKSLNGKDFFNLQRSINVSLHFELNSSLWHNTG